MDKTSIKVLKHLKDKDHPVEEADITNACGPYTAKSLEYLSTTGYIKQGQKFGGACTDPVTGRAKTYNVPNGKYEITALGIDFLEHRAGNIFDKWLGRVNIIFPILGGALLSKPLWSILEWSWTKILLFVDWICGLF